MGTERSRAITNGFIVVLIAVSIGITFGGVLGALLGFAGVIAGANVIAAGVLMAGNDQAAPVSPVLFDRALALAASLRRGHLTVAGLVMASCAVPAVSGEADPEKGNYFKHPKPSCN